MLEMLRQDMLCEFLVLFFTLVRCPLTAKALNPPQGPQRCHLHRPIVLHFRLVDFPASYFDGQRISFYALLHPALTCTACEPNPPVSELLCHQPYPCILTKSLELFPLAEFASMLATSAPSLRQQKFARPRLRASTEYKRDSGAAERSRTSQECVLGERTTFRRYWRA